jgi:hypothetical protein
LNIFLLSLTCLVGVGKTTHTGHNAKNVVVGSIDTELLGEGRGSNVGVNGEEESGIVDTRHVAGARGLVILGLKSEGVNVDTN